MTKTRHSSLEMPDAEIVAKEQKKKQDMLSKAKNKLYNLGDVWNWSRHDAEHSKKSRTQATLDYFFKSCPNNKEKVPVQPNPNINRQRRASSLQKQHSVDSHPLKIDLSDDEEYLHPKISRDRPATLCVDRINGEARETAALALERPRKKLSFREPEIMGYAIQVSKDTLPKKNHGKKTMTPEMKRSTSVNNTIHRNNSWDDLDLEVLLYFSTFYFLLIFFIEINRLCKITL